MLMELTFFVIIFTAFAFSTYFVFKARKVDALRQSSYFLGLFYFLFFLIINAMYLVISYPETEGNSIVDIFSLLFYVAIIAMPQTFFLYAISLSEKFDDQLTTSSITKHYYLPIVLLIIDIFSFSYLKLSNSETTFMFQVCVDVMNYSNFIALLFIFPILNCYYIFKTISSFLEHKKSVSNMYSYEEEVGLKWMFEYIIGYCLFIIMLTLTQLFSESFILYQLLGIFLVSYFFYICYRGNNQVKVYFEETEPLKQEQEQDSIEMINNGIDEEFTLSEENISTLKEKILLKMQEEPYISKSLNLTEFSKSINSNNKYISLILNSVFEQTFPTFINFYRIEKAKTLLRSETSGKYTIESIGEQVGFHSKSAFNRAFKKFETITPSAYKKLKNPAETNALEQI